MFEAWGRALYRWRWLALGIAVLLTAAAGLWGSGVSARLSASDNFTPPASQSQREAALADQVFGRDDAGVVVLYHSPAMTVTDSRYRQAVSTALARLPRADVAAQTTYWTARLPAMVSAGGHATYAVLQLVGDDIVHAGNTSSASIPLALSRMAERGDVQAGSPALLLGFGAGLCYAAQVVTVP